MDSKHDENCLLLDDPKFHSLLLSKIGIKEKQSKKNDLISTLKITFQGRSQKDSKSATQKDSKSATLWFCDWEFLDSDYEAELLNIDVSEKRTTIPWCFKFWKVCMIATEYPCFVFARCWIHTCDLHHFPRLFVNPNVLLIKNIIFIIYFSCFHYETLLFFIQLTVVKWVKYCRYYLN